MRSIARSNPDQPQAAWYVAKDPCSLLSKTIRLSKAVAYFS